MCIYIILFIYIWLFWVFVAVCRFSFASASGISSAVVLGFLIAEFLIVVASFISDH